MTSAILSRSSSLSERRVKRSMARHESNRSVRLNLGNSLGMRVAAFAVLLLLALVWIIPILWGAITSFKSEADAEAVPLSIGAKHGFNLQSYRAIFRAGNITTWMLNSIIVAVSVTVVTVAVSALAAYAISRLEFPGRKLLYAFVVASIMIPTQILIVPLFRQMVGMHLVDTLLGVILPQTVAPMMVFILKQFFDGIPRELEEAALIDGASRLRILWSIVLPLSRSILVAVSIFVFIGAWNNFLWPFIITNDPNLMTLPVGLGTVKDAYGVQYSQTMAGAMIAALPLLVIFMLFQRQVVRGIATTGLGGQ